MTTTQVKKSETKMSPKIIWKNSKEFIHHLFKLKLSTCLKNQSWKKDVVMLENIEHVHIFHSVNSQGMEQKHSTPVAGHFHAVTLEIDKDGNFVPKCGPAMTKIMQKMPNGTKKSAIVPVKFFDGMATNEDGTVGKWIVDSHTHEFEYKGSEKLSPQAVKQMQSANASQISTGDFKDLDGE